MNYLYTILFTKPTKFSPGKHKKPYVIYQKGMKLINYYILQRIIY